MVCSVLLSAQTLELGSGPLGASDLIVDRDLPVADPLLDTSGTGV